MSAESTGRAVYGPIVRTPEELRKRAFYERIWVVVGILWAAARVALAKATVEKYGVNITTFAIIEIVSSWPHGTSSARVVTSLIDREPNAAFKWGALLAVSHVAPELYIAVVGNKMPVAIYLSLLATVLLLGVLALVGIRQKVKLGRSEADQGEQAEHTP